MGMSAYIAILQLTGSVPIATAPQPLHLCAPPADPIEDEYALARHGLRPEDE